MHAVLSRRTHCDTMLLQLGWHCCVRLAAARCQQTACHCCCLQMLQGVPECIVLSRSNSWCHCCCPAAAACSAAAASTQPGMSRSQAHIGATVCGGTHYRNHTRGTTRDCKGLFRACPPPQGPQRAAAQSRLPDPAGQQQGKSQHTAAWADGQCIRSMYPRAGLSGTWHRGEPDRCSCCYWHMATGRSLQKQHPML